MAIGDYRTRIKYEPEVSTDDKITFTPRVEREVAEGAWVLIPGGARSVVLAGNLVREIKAGPGTDVQKLNAIAQLITARIESFGIAASDKARQALLSLYPNGEWPEGGFTIPFTV